MAGVQVTLVQKNINVYHMLFIIIEAVLWSANETVTLRTSCHPEHTSGIFSVLHDRVNSKESEDGV